MSAQHSTRKLSLTPFLGIALADILANGVAIIMLLIVITISTKYQLEEEKLEQVDEVSQVLSRDIVNSVVMNNLSASPPAVLHSYVDSAHDRDQRHAVMPILELHENNIRDYYNGRIWSREQLLRQDNPFDDYLRSLDAQQRLLLRTDIYEVSMFYIYMSILKDHKIIPRHWHFALDKPGQGFPVASAGDNSDGWSNFFGKEQFGDNDGMGNDLQSSGQGGGTSANYQSLQDGHYPWDAMSMNGSGEEEATGTGTAQGGELRFRLASPDNRLQLGQLEAALSNSDEQQILAGLLSYLKLINTQLEQQQSIITLLHQMPQYLQKFIATPVTLSLYEQQAIKQITHARLGQQLVGALSQADYLSIEYRQQRDIRGLVAGLQTNQIFGNLKIFADDISADYLADLPKYGDVHFHLQNYPELLQGLSLELEPGSVILAADYAVNDTWRWYPVFFIYPEFDDFVMGFIYGTIPASGQMRIAVESNRLTIAGYSLHLPRHDDPGESEYLLAVIFGLILLALLLVYSALLWRHNIRSAAT